jgi:NitT/TauT family transport system substrate-binding protein
MSALPSRRLVAAGLPLVLILGALLACAPATPTTAPAASAPAVGPAAAAGSATTAPSLSARPLVSLKVAWFTVGGQSAPLWVAQDAGLFRKHGLDVELVFIEGGTTAVQAAVAGEVPIITTGSQAVVNARLVGADILDLAHYVPTLPYVLVANPRIHGGPDLRGGTVATARRGAASDVAFQYAVRKLGLDPATDVTVLQIGAQESRFGALQAGSIDATVVDEAFGEEATRLGYPVLADVRDLRFPFVSVAASGDMVRQHPDDVRAFMRAFVEAIRYFKTERAESERILERWMKTDDAKLIDDTWDAYAHRYLEDKPYPTVRGAEAMLEFAAQHNPRAAGADPTTFIYPRFVEELDRGGFIDGLAH